MGFQNEMDDGGPLNQVLSRRFGVSGPPSPTVASDVFPTVEVGDEGMSPEYHFLAGSRLALAGFVDSAVSAQNSAGHLTNPANSGVIAVLERIIVQNSTTAARTAAIRNEGGPLSAMDTSPAGFFRESRLNFETARSTLQVGNNTSASQPGQIVMRVVVPPESNLILRIPWVLGPQSRIIVEYLTTNNGITGNFVWRERALVRGEVQGAIT